MKQIYPDLWITEPEHPLTELPDLLMCAYLLVRPTGNVLFCRSEHHADHLQIKERGGITHQFLTHIHEAAPGLARIKDTLGSQLVCHRLAEYIVSRFCPVDITFDTRHVSLGDIEVIPSPGHTAGSSCFRFKSPHGKTYLFAGDTVFPSRGGWEAIVLDDGNKADLKESLAMLRSVEADVVLCGAAVADVPFRAVSRAEWHGILDQATRSLVEEKTEAPAANPSVGTTS